VLRKTSPTPEPALEPLSQQCSILLLCLIGGLHGLTTCRAEMGNQEAATGAVVSSHLAGEASLILRGSRKASDELMSLARSTASGVNETLRMKWRHPSGRARLDSEIKVEAMKVVPLPSACLARRILGRGGWRGGWAPRQSRLG
jgi:hypothetical protein